MSLLARLLALLALLGAVPAWAETAAGPPPTETLSFSPTEGAGALMELAALHVGQRGPWHLSRVHGGAVGPPPPVTFNGPWWYDGTTPPAAGTALNGQTTNGLTWTGNGGSSTNVTAITTSTTADASQGSFRGNVGASANLSFVYVTAPTTTSKWVNRALGLTSTLGFGNRPADFITFPSCCVSGTNSWTYLATEETALGAGSLLSKFGVGIGGTTTPTTNNTGVGPANITVAAADNETNLYYPCPSGTCLDELFDGQAVRVAFNVSSLGVDMSQAFRAGWNGAIGAAGPNQYRYLGICDPDTQACVTANMANRIAPVDLNGDLTLHFNGTFTQASLGGLKYSLIDPATNLPIVGFANLPVTVASSTTAPPATSTITASITLTSASVTAFSDYVRVGDGLSGNGAAAGTYVTSITGGGGSQCLNNSGGTYTTWGTATCTIVVSPSQTLGSGVFTVTHTQAPAGSYYASATSKILAVNIPASFIVKLCRTDIAGGSLESCAWGPVQTAGENHGWMGQSIPQQGYPFGTDFTFTTAFAGFSSSQKSYYVDGGYGGPGNKGSAGSDTSAPDMRALAVPTGASTNNGGALNLYNYTWMIANSSLAVQTIRGGIGGTTAAQRAAAGSMALVSFLQGIDDAGGELTRMVDSSGTFDISISCPGCTTDYAASRDSFYSAVETKVGHALIVAQVVLGTSQGVALGASQAPYDTIRRIQYNQGIAGGRYCPVGLSLAELAHKAGDQYHLTAEGSAEHYRRGALAQLDCKNGGTTYKRGLYVNSVVEVDDHTADVTFDAPNAASALVTNAGNTTYGDDQGLNFGVWNGSSLTTALGALNSTATPTCGPVSASQVTCRFGFTGTPFAGSLHVAVTGQRGSNPFHHADTVGDTINNTGTGNKDYWADGMNALMAVYPSTAAFTAGTGGSPSTALVVSAVASGTIHTGDWVLIPGTTQSFQIIAQASGTTGGAGTYTTFQTITITNGTSFNSAEPMVPVQPYFKSGGSSTGSDDFVTSP